MLYKCLWHWGSQGAVSKVILRKLKEIKLCIAAVFFIYTYVERAIAEEF